MQCFLTCYTLLLSYVMMSPIPSAMDFPLQVVICLCLRDFLWDCFLAGLPDHDHSVL